MSNVEVFCSLQIEGIHCWADCPLKEVWYLRTPHRHLFGIKAYKRVDHDDRETEFILLKHQIAGYLRDRYYDGDKTCVHDFGGRSCEMIGRELLNHFKLSRVEVNEDNENGAIVYAIEIQR